MSKGPARYKKRGDSWTTRVWVPDPATGGRKQKRLTAPTVRELKALEADTIARANQGTYVEPARLTTAAYLDQWLEAASATVRPATFLRYEQVIRNHIKPRIGHVPLAKLTPLTIQGLVAQKQQDGLAAATIELIFSVVHRALGQAVKWRMIARNPADGVEVPRKTQPEVTTWSLAEARRFLAVADEHPLAALWRLAVTTGMRRGELLALRWEDVQLTEGRLAVQRTQTRGRDKAWTTGDPKTAAGRREIALESTAIAALKTHKATQNERRLVLGPDWVDADLVFDRGNGTHHHPSTVDGAFKRLCQQAGVPVVSLHDVRHTHATVSLQLGVHPKIVQERLGHGSIAMTLNRYSHVSMSMQATAVEKFEAALAAGDQVVTKAG